MELDLLGFLMDMEQCDTYIGLSSYRSLCLTEHVKLLTVVEKRRNDEETKIVRCATVELCTGPNSGWQCAHCPFGISHCPDA